MLRGVGKYLINFTLIIAAFYIVEVDPAMAWILAGLAAFLLFFFRSREAIIIYSLYFAFEETILLHCPAPFLILLKYLGDILILAVFLATFAKLAIRRYNLSALKENNTHIPLFLFLICALISALANRVPLLISFISVRQLLRYIVLYYSLILTAEAEWTQADLKNLAKIIIGLILVEALLGYFQLLLGQGSTLNQFLSTGNLIQFEGAPISAGESVYLKSRALFGTLITPNAYGLLLAGGFCLLLGLYLAPPKQQRDIRLLGALLFVLIPILKTYSRQSIYACLLSAVVMAWIKKEFKIIFIALLIVGAFSFYLFQLKEFTEFDIEKVSLASRIISPFHAQYREKTAQSGRLYAIREITPKILDSPNVLFGFGPGAIGSAFGFYQHYYEGYKKMGIPQRLWSTVHIGTSDVGFLTILGQYGLLGFLSFFAIFILLFRYILVKALPILQDPFYNGIAMGFLGYIVALVVSNIAYANFTIRQISFYFWILAGIVSTFRRTEQRTEQPA